MSTQASETQKRKISPLAITATIVAILVIAGLFAANVYTDVLWFEQLGYLPVLITRWIAVATLFLAGFLAMAVPLWITLAIAYKKRPVYAKINSQIDRYQELVEPLRKLIQWGAPLVLGVFAGVNIAASWQDILLLINSAPTGKADPAFGLDLQFYMFTLPVLSGLIDLLQSVTLVCLVAALAVAYIYGGIAITGKELRVSKSTRVQAAVLAAVWLLLLGGSYWLDQYQLLTDSSGLITGAAYTDANARVPGVQILAGIALLLAILFLVTAVSGKWRLPTIGTALFVVATLVLSVGVPWGVQQFRVGPDEKSLESEYIQRNISATRAAYGLENIEVQRYDAVTTAEVGALRDDAVATANIRIMDPAIISPTFAQLEQSKQYYKFHSSLSVDRYNIDGRVEDTVSVPREIDVSQQKSWYNKTLVYTHGYGLVAAYGNQRSPGGEPVFLENGIPTSGKLGEFEPRIYFGRYSPEYSIVGGKRERPIELDYPADVQSSAEQTATDETVNDAQASEKTSAVEVSDSNGERQNLTTFNGDGGPVLHGAFEKLLYALKFQSTDLMLSDAVVDGSQILYKRDPVDRVAEVAPFLTLDRQPYATVVDGRVVWIIDGYTTSDRYPYAQKINMNNALRDADNESVSGYPSINYIRNSVKATVDAYDGSVKLYAWDTEDPILKAWQKVYPASFTKVEKMSADLLSHVRYPNDLFKVQRDVLGDYHVTDAGAFYSNEDAWRTPDNPGATATATTETDENGNAVTTSNAAAQPPYYLTMSAGADAKPSFSIYSTYIPNQRGENARDILTGYLAADANAGTGKDGEIAADYGKLRLLVLPKGEAINGPGQVQNNFNTDPEVSRVLNILRQGETTVVSGNLLTLPVGGGLLYVQPVYVKSATGRGFPLLQKVLVSFGDEIAFENTLDEALDKLFGGNSGAAAGDGGVTASQPSAEAQSGQQAAENSATPSQASGGSQDAGTLNEALQQMRTALTERDAAMREGDWSAYGEADKKLQAALEKAITLSE